MPATITSDTAQKYEELLTKLETLLLGLAEYPEGTENGETMAIDMQIQDTFTDLGNLQAMIEEETLRSEPLPIFVRRPTYDVVKPKLAFINLPPEIHREIAKNLAGVEELRNLTETCRTMYRRLHDDNLLWWSFFKRNGELQHMTYDPVKNYQVSAYTVMDAVTRRCCICLAPWSSIMYYRRRAYRSFCRQCVEHLFIQYRGFMETQVLDLKIPQTFVGIYGRPRSLNRTSSKKYILKTHALKLVQEERRWGSFCRQRAIEFKAECATNVGPLGIRSDRHVQYLDRVMTDIIAAYRLKFTRYHVIKPIEQFRLFLEHAVLTPSKGFEAMDNCERSVGMKLDKFCENFAEMKRANLIKLAEHVCEIVFGPVDNDVQEQMFGITRPSKMGAFFDLFLNTWFEATYGNLFQEVPADKEVSCRWCETGPLYVFIPGHPADKYLKKDMAAHLFWCHSEILMTGRQWRFGDFN
ncbi:hypothetical protein TWF696_001506 [Orbilia brochopaga]|uniref:F-box domain-containing protein n=1 Tax=Orbilia brochopaga TaxID=3140254 RepID=A0AAV9UBQ6_9PEZI